MMQGYVIQSVNGDFLAKGLWWFAHDKAEDAWVHPPEILETLKEIVTENWIKPAYAIEAIRYPSTTILTGKIIELEF